MLPVLVSLGLVATIASTSLAAAAGSEDASPPKPNATALTTVGDTAAPAGADGRTSPLRGSLAMTMTPLTTVAVEAASVIRHHAVGPRVIIRVDLSEQRMAVIVEGKLVHSWPVSSGTRGRATPTGFWTPYRMHTMWRSRKYDNAPMAHSIFFYEGFAIHATPYVSRLGRPASHGCVRLAPNNATALFDIVKSYGRENVRVSITP